MTVRARTVFIQALFVATAIVVTALPARADGAGTLDPVSSNLAFRSLFDTASAASAAEEGQRGGGNPRHEGIGIGAKIGPLFSNFRNDITPFENKTGWMGGIFFGGNRPGIVGVMGELMYAKKGAKLGVNETSIHYLEIPVLLRVNAGSNSLNGILGYFIVGPAFDIKLRTETNGVKDDSDAFEDFDIGIVVGGGVEITRFIIEARGNWGLRQVNKGDLSSAQEIKTKSFALLFGVRFN